MVKWLTDRHFGTKTVRHWCKLSMGDFGTSAKLSGHYGAKALWQRDILVLGLGHFVPRA